MSIESQQSHTNDEDIATPESNELTLRRNVCAVFVDYDALTEVAKTLDVEIDVASLVKFLSEWSEDRILHSAYAYISINPRLPHARDREIEQLESSGCVVREVKGENIGISFVSDPTPAMMADIYRCVYEEGVGTVSLVSGSEKLCQLVTDLKAKGIMTELAFYQSGVEGELARLVGGFIDLESFIDEEEDSEEPKPDPDDEDEVSSTGLSKETPIDKQIADRVLHCPECGKEFSIGSFEDLHKDSETTSDEPAGIGYHAVYQGKCPSCSHSFQLIINETALIDWDCLSKEENPETKDDSLTNQGGK